MIFAVAGLSALIGAGLGVWTGRRGHWALLATVILAALALMAYLLWSAQSRPRTGFDGVAEVALAIIGLGPLVVVALCAAWLSRRRS